MWSKLIGGAITLAGALVIVGTNMAPAGAQTSVSPPLEIVLNQATPPAPGASAAATQWSDYATVWNGALQGGVKTATWNGSVCPVVSFQPLSVPSSLAKAAGVGTSAADGFAMTLNCPIDSAGSSGAALATNR